jgi:hypothetical protein
MDDLALETIAQRYHTGYLFLTHQRCFDVRQSGEETMHMNYVSVLVAAQTMVWGQCGFAHAQTASHAPTPQTYPHRLTATELRVLYPDSTFYVTGIYGPKTYTVYFSANGQVRLRSAIVQDIGTWRITDDGLFCSKYVKIRGGNETCQTVRQTGPDTIENQLPGGEIVIATGHVSGNPDGL